MSPLRGSECYGHGCYKDAAPPALQGWWPSWRCPPFLIIRKTRREDGEWRVEQFTIVKW